MHRFFLICLLAFPTTFLTGLDTLSYLETFCVGEIPSWVKRCDIPLEEISPKFSQVNLQYLLHDTQYNGVEKNTYCHYAIKALTQGGVSDVATIGIGFYPSYQKVVVHGIRVYRNNQWSDRMQGARSSLLHREQELEFSLYDGMHTLVYILEDICAGDIVEWAFTIDGEIPFFSSHLTEEFSLQAPFVVERLYHRILAGPESHVEYKLFHGSPEPNIEDLSESLREWVWELSETSVCDYEDQSPSWHQPHARVQFSQYQTWSEVAQKLLPLYILPQGFSDEIFSIVKQWMKTTPQASERAMLAVRFVQDEVRYQGFEEGLSGFKPANPQDVFKNRYGDCKDKTFLLHALLSLMGIDSTPVMVHTCLGKLIPDLLPTPFAFNHIVLQIELEGNAYWVDSTIQLQGGSTLSSNVFPNYDWGLPISKTATGLIEALGSFQEGPIEIDTSIVVADNGSIEMTVSRTFSGHCADSVRSYLDWRGVHYFSGDFLNFLQKTYGAASASSPASIVDDKKNDKLIVNQAFSIPLKQMEEGTILKLFSC